MKEAAKAATVKPDSQEQHEAKPPPLPSSFQELYDLMIAHMPGSWFGYAAEVLANGYWSLECEYALRADWTAADELALRERTRSASELRLWQDTLDLYDCTPRDLFRYGLELDLLAPDDDGAGSDPSTNVHIPNDLADQLRLLLLNPVWGTDVALPRFILQAAVMRRVPYHAAPLGPPYSRALPAFVRTTREWASRRGLPDAELRREEGGVNVFRWRTAFLTCEAVGALDADMRDADMRGTEDLREREGERFRFLLRRADVAAARAVVERRYAIDAAEAAARLARGRERRLASGGGGASAEVDHEALVGFKREWVLSLRREAAIRERMMDWARSDSLCDVPPFDPDPLYEHCLYDEVAPEQVLALQGWCRPFRTLVAPSRGCPC